MIQMFNDVVIIDDFVSSHYGLFLASFDYNGEEEVDFALGAETETVFLGNNRTSTLTNAKYQDILTPRVTLIKPSDDFIEISILRNITRKLTGKNTWSWMQVYNEEYGEILYYRCIVTSLKCLKIRGKIAGIIIDLECDSAYAYTKAYKFKKVLTTDDNIMVINNTSDELYDYLPCEMKVVIDKADDLFSITNISDTDYASIVEDVAAGEELIFDSSYDTLESSSSVNVLNRFNFRFPKMVPGKNTFKFSAPCTAEIKYRLLRKVGI